MLANISFQSILRNIPFFGALFNSTAASLIAASKELLISTIFSTLPIWFFPGIYTFFFKDTPPFLTNVRSSVIQGDLYIYASAIVGPLIFAITYNYANWGDDNPSPSSSRIGKLTIAFPHGTWFFCTSVLISMVAVICFGLMRFESSGFIAARLDKDALLSVSIWLYLFSLICLFLVSVYRNDLSGPTARISDNANDFVKEWNSRNA